jgi:hypothetical protein
MSVFVGAGEVLMPLGLRPDPAMLAPCVAASASPPMSARASSSSLGQGRLGAPDDLCGSDDAKDLDKISDLVEQVSVSVVFAPFGHDDHRYKTWGDLFNPAGVYQNAIYSGHRMTHPLKLRQRQAAPSTLNERLNGLRWSSRGSPVSRTTIQA